MAGENSDVTVTSDRRHCRSRLSSSAADDDDGDDAASLSNGVTSPGGDMTSSRCDETDSGSGRKKKTRTVFSRGQVQTLLKIHTNDLHITLSHDSARVF